MNAYTPVASITPEDLAALKIYADAETLALLPFTALSPQEFEIIHSTFDNRLDDRDLRVRIGGITYKLASSGKDLYTEVEVKVKESCFMYPLDVRITQTREPSSPNDHSDYCPFAGGESWPTDEEGNPYWEGEDGERIYDLENLDCTCEWVEVNNQEFTVADDADLAVINSYFVGLD